VERDMKRERNGERKIVGGRERWRERVEKRDKSSET
jgi:hypothetical protein